MEEPGHVLENMLVIEEQLRTLNRVTKLALAFHREHAEAREFDLVDIAESAFKLHAEKLHRHGVKIDRQFRGPSSTRVFGK
jgi:hypothetical protein